MLTILIFIIFSIILKFIIDRTKHQLDNAPIIIYIILGMLIGILVAGNIMLKYNIKKDVVSTYDLSKLDNNPSLCECDEYIERINFDYIVNINNRKTIVSILNATVIQSNSNTPKIVKYMVQRSEDNWTYWFTINTNQSPKIVYDIFIPLGSDIKYLRSL